MARRGAGRHHFAMAIGGEPARIEGLAAGEYTACAAPLPAEVDRLESQEYVIREGDSLPVYCRAVALRGPPERRIAIEVEIPPDIEEPPDGGEGD